MPGPPPKPAEKARKLGNPGKRKMPDRSKIVALPSMKTDKPDSLGAEGSRFWDQTIEVCSGWLGNSDYEMVRLCAEAMDRRAFMLRVLAEEGWSVVTDKGYPYKHPLVGPLMELESQIGKWMAALGMTPADRTRMGVAEVKARSVLEQLREKRG